MKCGEEEIYETPYDGIKGFQCFKKECFQGTEIVRCIAEHYHNYPLWHEEHHEAAAEIAWNFMKNHPRNNK